MLSSIPPTAISGIRAPDKIRIVIYANNQIAHVPLTAITQTLEKRLAALEKELETIKAKLK